jgi:hypothetical protein
MITSFVARVLVGIDGKRIRDGLGTSAAFVIIIRLSMLLYNWLLWHSMYVRTWIYNTKHLAKLTFDQTWLTGRHLTLEFPATTSLIYFLYMFMEHSPPGR